LTKLFTSSRFSASKHIHIVLPKAFITLAILRRSIKRLSGAHLLDITPRQLLA